MGEATHRIPKPMITIGTQPILWHIMKWYASWGHKDFVLCLGHRGEVVKEYFLNYNEALANDFVLSEGGKEVEVLGSDISDWSIAFVDTGVQSAIGERLRRVRHYVEDEEYFLATYGDGVTNAPLNDMIDVLQRSGKIALFMSVRPRLEYHLVRSDETGVVKSVERLADSEVRINGGFFVFKRDVFQFLEPGEELVEEPFARLIERGELLAYRYDGFWEPMDTIKDKQRLDALVEGGRAPWQRPIGAA